MRTPAYRGLVLFGAILVMAATTTIADARIGGLNLNSPISHSMTTTLDPGRQRGWGDGGYVPPPAVNNWPRHPQFSDDTGGGGTGGFNPGGGSGTTPKKKPNLQ